MLRAARTAKRGGSLCATTAQSITQWNYAVWAATPPSRRVGYLTSSLWLRRPAGACGGLRGHLPAASDTDRALIGGFGAAAVGGRDLGRCFALRALALPRHTLPLASLMANGDAWDAITMRIAFVAAADAVTARRPRGRRSGEAVIVVRTRPFVAFSTLMVWVLRMWAGRQVVGGVNSLV